MSGGGGDQTVGYKYYLGLHMGVCAGPVDSLISIKIGDRDAWTGSVTASGQITINAADLFGGEEKEGGVVGFLDVMMGEASQGINGYLAEKQATKAQPAYRGLLGVVFRGGYIAANNPYVKPWAFKVRRILKGWQNDAAAWYAEKAAITLPTGDLAMNPAHIAYEVLSNQEWGMGYGSAQIDDANFKAAADKFHAEGLGLCMKWTQQEQIEGFLQIVMDHAGAVLGQDKRTGLFVINPIRGGYDVNTLPVFDESNVVSIDSYQRPGLTDAVNEVTVKFGDVTNGKTGSVTVQNLANITAQGGVSSQTKNYVGIPTAELAVRTALRDLRAVSTPIAKVRMRVNRTGYDLLPGSLVRLNWQKLGITGLVLRVIKVNMGTLTASQIDVEAVEDVFGLPAAGYAAQEPTGWTDPRTLPAPAANRVVQEAGYWELQRRMSSSELAGLAPDAGFLSVVAPRPSSDSLNYAVYTRSGSSGAFTNSGIGDFCPTATLAAGISQTATAITLASIVDPELVKVGAYAQLDSELVRIDAFDATAKTATIGRGVLDTVAATHALGARLYFAQDFGASDGLEHVDGELIQVKLLPATGRGRLSEGSAPTDSLTFDQRAYRPYPPGRFRINSLAYPDLIEDQPLTVSWAHRDRLQQNLQGDETGNIGPEAGTTYSVRVVNAATEAQLSLTTGVTGASQALPPLTGTYSLRVELWSVRSGLASRQMHAHTFNYINVNRLTTEAADKLTTEAGDYITSE